MENNFIVIFTVTCAYLKMVWPTDPSTEKAAIKFSQRITLQIHHTVRSLY